MRQVRQNAVKLGLGERHVKFPRIGSAPGHPRVPHPSKRRTAPVQPMSRSRWIRIRRCLVHSIGPGAMSGRIGFHPDFGDGERRRDAEFVGIERERGRPLTPARIAIVFSTAPDRYYPVERKRPRATVIAGPPRMPPPVPRSAIRPEIYPVASARAFECPTGPAHRHGRARFPRLA